jgi:hypothetical protein
MPFVLCHPFSVLTSERLLVPWYDRDLGQSLRHAVVTLRQGPRNTLIDFSMTGGLESRR